METRNWIGGEWIIPDGGDLPVINPSDLKEEIGTIHLSETTDALQAGEAARYALTDWANMPGAKRGEFLYRIANMLELHTDEIAFLGSKEMGKPISEMKGEVTRGVQLLRYYAGEGVRPVGNVIPSNAGRVLQYTKRVPLGVIGIITPWNFPVAIPIWKIAPALICGNTVIWKPAEIASLTATRLTELFAEAGLPEGVLNLVIGKGRVIGNTLLEQVELDGVSFTGSTAVGQQVALACAKRNIKFQTEMGGKNAAIVLKDADLRTTVPALVSGAFKSAGQKCTATSRIIVEEGIYTSLVDSVREVISGLHVSHALDPDAYLGPVASKDQFNTVQSYVQMAQNEAEMVAVGKIHASVNAENGHYIPPMVISGVSADHPLIQEEIFGPVTTMLPVKSVDEAIALCNQTIYGLSAAIFTNNLSDGLRFLDEAQAGMVRVNLETAGVEYQAPFGGMKLSSSHTREQGQAALDFYSQVKTCAVYYGPVS
jgi:alpha-ketoglutaric semialdehyde dehydrogenase